MLMILKIGRTSQSATQSEWNEQIDSDHDDVVYSVYMSYVYYTQKMQLLKWYIRFFVKHSL